MYHDGAVVEVVHQLAGGWREAELLLVVEVRICSQADQSHLSNSINASSLPDFLTGNVLVVQVDLILAVNIRVLVGQAAAVDDLEDEVNILANQLVRRVHKLVICLRVLTALLVTGGNFQLGMKVQSR